MCEKHGISHSHFHGGPPRWTPSDRDKALWRLMRERERCGECGTRRSEWDEKQGGDRNAYRAAKTRCRGCEVLKGAQKTVDEKRDGLGTGISLRKR